MGQSGAIAIGHWAPLESMAHPTPANTGCTLNNAMRRSEADWKARFMR